MLSVERVKEFINDPKLSDREIELGNPPAVFLGLVVPIGYESPLR